MADVDRRGGAPGGATTGGGGGVGGVGGNRAALGASSSGNPSSILGTSPGPWGAFGAGAAPRGLGMPTAPPLMLGGAAGGGAGGGLGGLGGAAGPGAIADPFATLAETVRTARTNASSLMLSARRNPSLQRLVTGYEAWQDTLRQEAQARLNGGGGLPAPLVRAAGGMMMGPPALGGSGGGGGLGLGARSSQQQQQQPQAPPWAPWSTGGALGALGGGGGGGVGGGDDAGGGGGGGMRRSASEGTLAGWPGAWRRATAPGEAPLTEEEDADGGPSAGATAGGKAFGAKAAGAGAAPASGSARGGRRFSSDWEQRLQGVGGGGKIFAAAAAAAAEAGGWNTGGGGGGLALDGSSEDEEEEDEQRRREGGNGNGSNGRAFGGGAANGGGGGGGGVAFEDSDDYFDDPEQDPLGLAGSGSYGRGGLAGRQSGGGGGGGLQFSSGGGGAGAAPNNTPGASPPTPATANGRLFPRARTAPALRDVPDSEADGAPGQRGADKRGGGGRRGPRRSAAAASASAAAGGGGVGAPTAASASASAGAGVWHGSQSAASLDLMLAPAGGLAPPPTMRRGALGPAAGGGAAAAAAAPPADADAAAAEAARQQLELVAARLLQQSRAAIQNAQASLQETAANCSQNLQSLGQMLQQAATAQGGAVAAAAAAGGVGVGAGAVGAGIGSGIGGGGAAAPALAASAWTRPAEGPPPSASSQQLPRALRPPQDAQFLGAGAAAADEDQDEQQQQQEGGGGGKAAAAAAALGRRPDGPVAASGAASPSSSPAPPSFPHPSFPSLRLPGRNVAIVTTASLPWMTGTAVNPLLRAAYLDAGDATRLVTLCLPWLSPRDQARVFPGGVAFDSPEAQEAYVRDWARKRTGLPCGFRVAFYPGRYAPEKGSILPVGDVTACVPDGEADVAVLEEPEHLSWYHHGARWTDKFRHVVGVMHTNYLDYARREREAGPLKEAVLRAVNQWVVRAYCHKVVKLSDAVQPLPRETTMFVHGVGPSFLEVGRKKAEQARAAAAAAAAATATAAAASSASASSLAPSSLAPPPPQKQGPRGRGRGKKGPDPLPTPPTPSPPTPTPTSDEPVWPRGAYFLGKVLWAKGYTELLDRLGEHAAATGDKVAVDVFGSGPDLPSVKGEAAARGLPLAFHGARDHADADLQGYRVFVNPSLSDVVATTTAEALAMGKWAVVAEHPSNAFFAEFPNCLTYRTPEEFSQKLKRALEEPPVPLTDEQLGRLTWEAATERFLEVAEVGEREAPNAAERAFDGALFAAHQALTGSETLRVLVGAGAGTRETPARVTDYVPRDDDLGWFDDAARAREARGAELEREAQAAAAAAQAAAAAAAAGAAGAAAAVSVAASAPAAASASGAEIAKASASGPPSHPVPSPRRQGRHTSAHAAAAAQQQQQQQQQQAAFAPAASVAAALNAAAAEQQQQKQQRRRA